MVFSDPALVVSWLGSNLLQHDFDSRSKAQSHVKSGELLQQSGLWGGDTTQASIIPSRIVFHHEVALLGEPESSFKGPGTADRHEED